MATRKVRKIYPFSCKDAKKKNTSLADRMLHRPLPYRIVYLSIVREGKEIVSRIPGWWTGGMWDGQRLLKKDQVICWGYKESKHE